MLLVRGLNAFEFQGYFVVVFLDRTDFREVLLALELEGLDSEEKRLFLEGGGVLEGGEPVEELGVLQGEFVELRGGGSMRLRLRLLWLLRLGLLARLGEVRVLLGLHPVDLFQELLHLTTIPFNLLVLEY